jgi:hypothetical protein
MSLPFFARGLGAACIPAGGHGIAIGLGAASIITMRVLFKLHATDAHPVRL